jgi:large subunit ribosomal protein L10
MSSKSFGPLVKKLLLGGLEKDAAESNQVFVTSFTKLSSNGISDLRKRLRSGSTRLRVVKNTVARKALAGAKKEGLAAKIDGQCALGFSMGDVSSVSKILVGFAEENETFRVESLYLDGQVYGSDQIKELAKLPSRQELLAKVCGGMNAPVAGMVNTLAGILRSMVNVTDAVRKQKEQSSS